MPSYVVPTSLPERHEVNHYEPFLGLVLADRGMDESRRSGRIGGNIVLPSLPEAKSCCQSTHFRDQAALNSPRYILTMSLTTTHSLRAG